MAKAPEVAVWIVKFCESVCRVKAPPETCQREAPAALMFPAPEKVRLSVVKAPEEPTMTEVPK